MQKSPMNSGSFSKINLQLKASYGSWPHGTLYGSKRPITVTTLQHMRFVNMIVRYNYGSKRRMTVTQEPYCCSKETPVL